MALMRLSIQASIDGKPVRGFPLERVYQLDEVQEFDYDEPGDSNTTTFSQLPASAVDTVQVLLVFYDNAVGQRVEGANSGSAAVRFSAGGFLICGGASITGTNVTVNVNSADVARIRGLVGGT